MEFLTAAVVITLYLAALISENLHQHKNTTIMTLQLTLIV